MSNNTSKTTAPDADETTVPTPAEGSWQETIVKAVTLEDRSKKGQIKAANLLWEGAKGAISAWLPASDEDVNAEGLASEALDYLGKSRKGTASKIKMVALAARNENLLFTEHDSLRSAYNAARALVVTAVKEAEQDDAAEKAVESISAPKTTSSVDGAALILLSKGIDGAVVAILDALGKDNEAAHRSFMRAVSEEIAGRTKPAPKVQSTEDKGEVKVATAKKAAAPRATVGKAKAKPVKKAAAPAPVVAAVAVDEPDGVDFDDLDALLDGDDEIVTENVVTTPAVPVTPTAKKKAKPVVVRR